MTITIKELVPKYRKTRKTIEHAKFTGSNDVEEYARKVWPFDIGHREAFVVLFLNRDNSINSFQCISQGGQAGTVADPKVIFQSALLANAAAIILVHNHPSGNLKPSDADVRLTDKLLSAGEILDLPVLDHIIIGPERYYSFADEGRI